MSPRSEPGSAIVLVVDDQEYNIQTVGAILSAEGFEIMAATSGEQALRRVAARPPDLILLDMRMPGMDGLETCRRLKASAATAAIPVIFLSAADEPDIVVAALEAGGVDYLTKPFHRAELSLRVRTHVELKQARDRLEDALKKKDRLMDILAHDLKNPLATIHMAAGMLAVKGVDSPERARRLADGILTSAADMLQFIEGFLARNAEEHTAGALRISRVDLQPLLRRAVAQYRLPAQHKQIDVIVEAVTGPVVVRGDRGAIGRVLDNLLSNAIKFSPPGKRVWISLRAEDGSGVLTVRDEGQGFSPEDKQAMFQSYRRLSARPTGNETSTGLGLSIVKRLVDAMGAEIRCESAPGAGAGFVVTLPLSKDDAAGAVAPGARRVP